MYLLELPEEILDNIITYSDDYHLYQLIPINRMLNIIINNEIGNRAIKYGGSLGLKYNIIYETTKLRRNNILEKIGTNNNGNMKYWTQTNFIIFGLELIINNSSRVSIWLNI